MALSSTSEVWAAYEDNLSYSRDQSVSKAVDFVEAAEFILIRQPKRSRHDGTEVEYDLEVIESRLKDAQRFIDQNGGVGSSRSSVRHLDFGGLRD